MPQRLPGSTSPPGVPEDRSTEVVSGTALAPTPPEGPDLKRRLVRAADSLAGPVLTALGATVAMIQALRVWDWRPGTPLGLDGDAASVTTWVRTVLEFGAYSDNPDLGAPFGQNLGWFPTADDVHFLAIRAIGLFTDSAFTAVAVYFFLGFPLAALAMYWLARSEGATRLAAGTVGVLFAVIPGHQTRFPHLFLAAYWVVPLGIWVVLRVSRGDSLFTRARGSDGKSRVVTARNAWSAVVVLCVSLGGIYHTTFVLLLLAAAIIIRAVSGYNRGVLLRGLATAALIGAISLTSLLAMHARTTSDLMTGGSPIARSPIDSEFLAGRIVDLVLPWTDHRVTALGALTRSYNAVTEGPIEVSALGLVSLLGVAAAITLALAAAINRANPRHSRVALYGLLAIVAIAFYTRGGLGSVFALFVTPEIRTWSRMVIIVALLGLLAIARWLSWVRRAHGVVAATTIAVVATVFGVLDQTNPNAAPDYAALRTRVAILSSLTQAMESALPRDCPVFQLPVIQFAGAAPVHEIRDYDMLLPYLASSHLRWSYGALRGTSRADWQLALPVATDPSFVDDVAAAGFCAVEIDGAGYTAATSPIPVLSSALGPPLAASSDGRLVAYPLLPRRAALVAAEGEQAVQRRADHVLHPVTVAVDGTDVMRDGGVPYQNVLGSSGVTVSNMGSTPVTVHVSFTAQGLGSAPRTLELKVPGAASQSVVLAPSAVAPVSFDLVAPRGATRVPFTVSGVPTTLTEPVKSLASARVSVTGATSSDPSVHIGVVQLTAP